MDGRAEGALALARSSHARTAMSMHEADAEVAKTTRRMANGLVMNVEGLVK